MSKKNSRAERFVYTVRDVDALKIISTGLPDDVVKAARKAAEKKGRGDESR